MSIFCIFLCRSLYNLFLFISLSSFLFYVYFLCFICFACFSVFISFIIIKIYNLVKPCKKLILSYVASLHVLMDIAQLHPLSQTYNMYSIIVFYHPSIYFSPEFHQIILEEKLKLVLLYTLVFSLLFINLSGSVL